MDNTKNLISRKQELEKKYGIDFDKLEKEQMRLAEDLQIKDKIDFTHAERFGAFDAIFLKNKMLCCIIVCDKNGEIVDQAYVCEKVKFPYVPGFRNYRELPIMIAAFEKINEKPDVIFISGQGIIHPRLGLASHFGLASGIPTIGVSNVLIDCTVEGKGKDGDYVIKNGKRVGKILLAKEGSNPVYISPGNLISINSAYELTKKLIKFPHKRPEPLHRAAKYSKNVKEEIVPHV